MNREQETSQLNHIKKESERKDERICIPEAKLAEQFQALLDHVKPEDKKDGPQPKPVLQGFEW